MATSSLIKHNGVLDDGDDKHPFRAHSQVPLEFILADEQLEDFISKVFPLDWISSWDLDEPFPSVAPHEPITSVGSIFGKLLDYSVSPKEALNRPVKNPDLTESHEPPPVEELVTPAASVVKESNASAKKPRNQLVVRGNNPYGKRGKKRCCACRRWKIKCEYESERMQCRLCKSRGWTCGAEEKVLGPKGQRAVSERSNAFSFSTVGQSVFPVTRISPVPEDEALTSFDATLLHQFLEYPMWGYIFRDGPRFAHQWTPNCYPIFSETFRHVLLVRASQWVNSLPGRTFSKENTYRYLNKSYQLIRRSASAGEYREVVYSSYILYGYEYLSKCPHASNDGKFIHCLGMWQAFAALLKTQSIVNQDELVQMEEFAYRTLRAEYNRLWKETADGVVHERGDRLLELLRATCDMGRWYWEDVVRRRNIQQLSLVFQVASHCYVLLRNAGDGMQEPEQRFVGARLERIADQIIELIPWIPEQWVVALAEGCLDKERTIALLQSWSQFLPRTGSDLSFWTRHFVRLHRSAVIIKCTLQQTPLAGDVDVAVSAASSLLTLSTHTKTRTQYDHPISLITSLFLAGLVFAQSQDVFAVAQIRKEIERRCERWPSNSRAKLEEHIMHDMEIMNSFWDAASVCPSLHEIWKIRCSGLNLSNVKGGFAPWYDEEPYVYWASSSSGVCIYPRAL